MAINDIQGHTSLSLWFCEPWNQFPAWCLMMRELKPMLHLSQETTTISHQENEGERRRDIFSTSHHDRVWTRTQIHTSCFLEVFTCAPKLPGIFLGLFCFLLFSKRVPTWEVGKESKSYIIVKLRILLWPQPRSQSHLWSRQLVITSRLWLTGNVLKTQPSWGFLKSEDKWMV